MTRRLWLIALLCGFLTPGFAFAQKIEPTKHWEVGDKLTYNWIVDGKPRTLVNEVVAVTGEEINFLSTAGDRTYDTAFSVPDMSYRKGVCFANAQACEYSPALLWVRLPLEQGKTWSGTTTVTGETFIAEIAYDREAGGADKIRTPAGQFDALKVSFSGRIKSKDKRDVGTSTGSESGTSWIAQINGRVVAVKIEYSNSYGEMFTVELLTAELR